jgi:hypothetical protein
MPNRDLKETNRRSASLQVLSDGAERLWYRLITAVDDWGRMEADAEVVFTTCFQRVPKGWSVARVERCLEELSSSTATGQSPLIGIYEVKGKRYLQILSAAEHIYRRAKESKYPHPLTPQFSSFAGGCAQMPADAPRSPADSLVSRSPNPESRIPNPESRFVASADRCAPMPADVEAFALTPELEAWAVKEGIQGPSQYVEEFKDFWRSAGGKRKNGQPVRDYAAAFRNWLRMLKGGGKLKSSSWMDSFARGEVSA